jgi:NNP family nitrate/nitrite transporter-like MFS transporter
LALLTVPVWAVLGVLAWRIWDAGVISSTTLWACLFAVAAVLVSQVVAVFRVNEPARRGVYDAGDQYPMRSVAVLCFAYFCTFGSEVAVVTMLPGFLDETWSLSPVLTGIAASSAAFLNLVARPGGGLLSDVLGSRRRTLTALLAGLGIGYVLMATLGPSWPVLAAVVLSLACSVFGQAGNGAVYAIVPLVKKRVTGQVAGLAGAYGNVGAVCFLTLLFLVGPRWFFLAIAAAGVLAAVSCRFLVEPEGSFADEVVVDLRRASSRTDPTLVPAPAAGA